MTAQMRIAVTGASGNVGTALLRAMADQAPNCEIVGICRRPPPADDPLYGRASWVACDVSQPESTAELERAFTGADAVLHLAWRIQPNRDPDLLWRTNVDGSRRVFDAAAAAGVPHLVYTSSLGAYAPAPKNHPVDESWPTTGIPTSAYSVQKAAVERELDSLELRDGPPATTRVRPALIFQRDIGSQVARYFFGPLVPKSVVGLARMPVLPVPDSVVFQCVHADDVADALWRILNSRSVGAFNLAATPVLTPRELAKVFRGRRGTLSDAFLREVVEMTWRLHLQPTDPGWIDLATSVPVMSTARAREDLGWYARRDARATMADLLDGIRAGAGTTSPVLAPRSRFLGSRNGRPQAEHLRTDRRARGRALRVEQRAPDGRDIDLRGHDSELVGP